MPSKVALSRDGVLGGGRSPGPVGISGHAPLSIQNDSHRDRSARTEGISADAVREEFLRIRRQMRDLLESQPLPKDGVVFYSGVPESELEELTRRFQSYLAGLDPPYGNTVFLEQTDAGKFLLRMTRTVLPRLLAQEQGADWNRWVRFDSGAGEFTASLMGFWRELSARYARLANGVVHVLLGDAQRLALPDKSQQFWQMRTRGGEQPKASMFLNELKTFGFVEFPILCGIIASNAGVKCIRVYGRTEGSFTHVRDIDPGQLRPAAAAR